MKVEKGGISDDGPFWVSSYTYNRTRAEIAADLRAWLVTLPKKDLNIVERVVAAVRGIFSG